ncbi:hypothetical protein ACWD33_16710 [Streptomyces xiamenensis]|uniref:hypothetical protein n=1 Tax=Streptomyces TaxID=1883 RepID=UPI00069494F0|nr:hypothetical protein [Streptomyces sp. NRRL F-2890]
MSTSPEPGVELLVHGVGGTTPQKMLEDPRTTRITGDNTASVHRRTDDAADRPWDDGTPLREAYSWSNLTSGNGARALWLLLLPFMVVNLAHWMRPDVRGTRRTQRLYDLLVRLLALSLTVLLVAGACSAALDLLAWQCGASAACTADVSWLAFWGPDGGWWAQPGRRLALATVLPLALTALLWWLSHRTWSAYESASPPVRTLADGPERPLLSLPGFWYGRTLVSRLRAAHTAVGLLTITAVLLTATGTFERTVWWWALTVLTASGWVAVAAMEAGHGRSEEEPDESGAPAVVSALPWASLALLAVTLVHTGWSRPQWTAEGALPAGDAFYPVLAIVQGVLVLGLALTAFHLHRHAPSTDRGALLGIGGASVAMIACALGGMLTGAVVQWLGAWLEPESAATGGPEAVIAGPPVQLSWQSSAIPALLVVLVVLLVVALRTVARRRAALEPGIVHRYARENCPPDQDRSRAIASAVARARLTDAAPKLIGVLTAASVVLGIAVVAGTLTGEPPAVAAADAPAPVRGFAEFSQTLGSWLAGFMVVALLAVGRRAYRDAAARRTIGILWDVGTFWPRAAHPFAPPCYAERAVPDLSWRMGTWIDSTGGRVIISGHSQGSVLAAAAVWQLDPATRSRVALLTYGSPLERLYSRWFPAYFGARRLDALRAELPCWSNLWRETDPIGGPVGQEPVDVGPLPDPLYYGRNLRRPLPEPILGHADYAADPAFGRARADLFERLAGGGAGVALPHQQPGEGAAEKAL